MRSGRKRLPGERVFTLLLVLFSGFMLWQAYSISGLESITSAGAFPLAAAALMLLCGIIVAVDTARMPRIAPQADASTLREFARLLTPPVLVGFTLAIVLYMLALEPVGFIGSSYLFLIVSMRLLGSRRWLLNLGVSAVCLGVIHVIFRTVFSVVLPSGSLLTGFWK